MRFTHQNVRQRVSFGIGNSDQDILDEVREFGAKRPLIIATASASEVADRVESQLPIVDRIDGARRHVPLEDVQRSQKRAERAEADAFIAIGGGSATGLAKAVVLSRPKPIMAVPTTYSGSEATQIWGITANGRKETGSDPRVLPHSVIYDAKLVEGLPAHLAISSGLNAMAHSIDAMWAPEANPINGMWAEEALAALFRALPAMSRGGDGDVEERQRMQYGAYMSAVAFSSAGSGLHHKICHVLGGAFDLPHAETHAIVLPYIVAYNASADDGASLRIGRAFGGLDPLKAILELRDTINAPKSLREQGLREKDLDKASRLVAQVVPRSNPRPLGFEEAERLVQAFWAGADPTSLSS